MLAGEAKPGPLSGSERTTKMAPLLTAGWVHVDGRDALHKDFLFKDFNEVG